MFRGLYTAWTGMANEQKRLDVISNNMANSNTVGYKDEKVASQAFDQVLGIKIRDGSQAYHNECIGSLSLGVKIGETYTDYSQGSVRQTGGTYDLALSGSGFFAVSVTDKAGEVHTRYTRDGRFHLTKDGLLEMPSRDKMEILPSTLRRKTYQFRRPDRLRQTANL